ncbi:hypothetical protein O181_030091 [Austropuccinia psidii MF-1]|uniref:Uncharacterized protein n=1 Tax=Austropuccinia psidii MF-1 TaxID=1389203 RepID=A0A9Q3H3X7_9BASI|nr:hypothetical protein [Austropuccinia psidii MF-1]
MVPMRMGALVMCGGWLQPIPTGSAREGPDASVVAYRDYGTRYASSLTMPSILYWVIVTEPIDASAQAKCCLTTTLKPNIEPQFILAYA